MSLQRLRKAQGSSGGVAGVVDATHFHWTNLPPWTTIGRAATGGGTKNPNRDADDQVTRRSAKG
jgi:hypothetical protein